MRLWRIAGCGDEAELRLDDSDSEEPVPGTVRVRVAAVGVNRADILQLRGLYPAPAGAPPDVPGLEYSGVVDACGDGVTRWQAGDRVMGLVPGGAYSESLVVPANECLPVPDGLDLEAAAAIPEPFLTAWRALSWELAVGAGECVAVRPGTAAVGQAAAQLARWMGAEVVATSREPDRLARVEPEPDWKPLTEGDHAERKRVFGNREGADALVDMLGGGGALDFGLRLLRPGGRYVGLGLMSGASEEVNVGGLLARGLSLRFMTMRGMPAYQRARLTAEVELRLLPALAGGRLVPARRTVFGFNQAPQALAHLRTGGEPGRVLLRMGSG
jgi:NADPH2:quinone reductase